MLHLGESHVIFEAGNALSDIFYDDFHKKIVIVRGKDVVEVKVYGLESDEVLTFQLKKTSKIRIIKFSPDKHCISVQSDESVVDFVNFATCEEGILSVSFSQRTKNRSARVIGLEWLQNKQILFITNQGFEMRQVSMEKRSAKLLRSHNISMYWYLYHPYSQLLIASSGVGGALLTPFIIQTGSIQQLAKCEVDFGHSNVKPRLLEREVFIISIYCILYIAVLRSSTRGSISSDIVLYKINVDVTEPPRLAHILCLDLVGAFALHVLNNVIVVHHQSSKTSLIFDIGLDDTEQFSCVSHHPLFKASLDCSVSLQTKFNHQFPLYSPSWVTFQPNFIADAHIGIFTSVKLNLREAENYISDKYQYLRFLYNRGVTKATFLENLKPLMASNKLKLKQIAHIFTWIAKGIVKRSHPVLKHSSSGGKCALLAEPYEEIIIEQDDVVGNLFLLPDDYSRVQKQRFLQYMLQYLTVLQENKIEAQPYFLHEVLIPTTISTGQLERLHQLLLYRVIPDSKQLAFQLLSHEAKYPPLVQLALDMLSRLGTASEEIVEVLIARNLAVEAIRFLESVQLVDKINCLKLIENAWKEDRIVRYAVFSYFLERGPKSRNTANSQQFDEFLKKFEALFKDNDAETTIKGLETSNINPTE
ncbi:unnamed protein product [Thelazia callipaeda]|uniref:Mic1 domain-containing protein n=1 Tax=Thelazia callipaeda TaxID=103827 RepID=A0A0N5CJN8_THECL|nr:unnamed protein product [Thelazia callipaeda]